MLLGLGVGVTAGSGDMGGLWELWLLGSCGMWLDV